MILAIARVWMVNINIKMDIVQLVQMNVYCARILQVNVMSVITQVTLFLTVSVCALIVTWSRMIWSVQPCTSVLMVNTMMVPIIVMLVQLILIVCNVLPMKRVRHARHLTHCLLQDKTNVIV